MSGPQHSKGRRWAVRVFAAIVIGFTAGLLAGAVMQGVAL